MDYRLAPLILSFIVFTSYIVSITIKFGWLRSVSISWYYIKNKWIFTISFWAFSVLLMIAGGTVLTFLAGAAICVTGSVADAKNAKMTNRVHVIGAISGIVLGMAALVAFGLWYLAVPQVILTILAIKLNMKNHTFWIELLAYYNMCLGIFINL